MSDHEDEPVCGESFDHDLILVSWEDGARTYECEFCGAEIWEDDDE